MKNGNVKQIMHKQGKSMKKILMLFMLCICMMMTVIGCEDAVTDSDKNSETKTEVVETTEEETEEETTEEPETETETETEEKTTEAPTEEAKQNISADEVPVYSGKAYEVVNGNVPYFESSELRTDSFESYGALDSLGRCSTAYANVGTDIMPTEDRKSIGQVKPTGWHTIKYDNVDGKYLYNRCHLIGFQLTGENANEKNLITGTRYLNIDGMLPFENMVADYVKETGNHVLYRVTPVYEGNNLVASGVLMEGFSVEDNGSGICYCVYAYNAQPGISIDYATGDSRLADVTVAQEPASTAPATPATVAPQTQAQTQAQTQPQTQPQTQAPTQAVTAAPQENNAEVIVHVTDTGTKYHLGGCRYLKSSDHEITLQNAKANGYGPCSTCNPPQ